ncbi:MAG: hypothetical protein SXA11_06800 [Cyanobacteriota bacterium]|nr:hypothetical protein [Cyanobacteriota bacterium]
MVQKYQNNEDILSSIKLKDILSCVSEEEDGTLKDLLTDKCKESRYSLFLGKIYAVQDLAIRYNDNNPIVNEIVAALIALGYAFEDDFKEEIKQDNEKASKPVITLSKNPPVKQAIAS